MAHAINVASGLPAPDAWQPVVVGLVYVSRRIPDVSAASAPLVPHERPALLAAVVEIVEGACHVGKVARHARTAEGAPAPSSAPLPGIARVLHALTRPCENPRKSGGFVVGDTGFEPVDALLGEHLIEHRVCPILARSHWDVANLR